MIPQVTETIKANPKVQQAVMSAVAKLSENKNITLEIINQIINMFEFALQNPNSYQQLRQAAIQSGKLKMMICRSNLTPHCYRLQLRRFTSLNSANLA